MENTQAPNTEKSVEDVVHEKKPESVPPSGHASEEKLDRLLPKSKIARAQIFTWILSILALMVSGGTAYRTYRNHQLDKKIHLQSVLDEAWDYLGGEYGVPKAGMTDIWAYPGKRNIEIASRKQKEASTLDPDNPKVIRLEADILRFLGKQEEAIEKYQMAIKANPKYAAAYNNLGLAYRDIYKIPESISAFEKAKDLDSKDPVPYVNLALTIFLKGDAETAISILNEALKMDPDNPHTLISLAGAYISSGREKDAIVLLNKVLLIDNDSEETYMSLGDAYYNNGQLEKALAFYETAARLDPTDALAYASVGDCLEELGRKMDAIEKYKTAFYLDPDYTLVLDNLARLYRQIGKTNEADALAQKSAKLKAENKKPYKIRRGRIILPYLGVLHRGKPENSN